MVLRSGGAQIAPVESESRMKISITGASGFIGRHLVLHAIQSGHRAVAVSRRNLGEQGLFNDKDIVIHLAGIAQATNSDDEYMAVNHRLTLSVARKAREAGCSRFVFVSSAAAATSASAYGRSKAAAERDLSSISGMQVVVVRPPLVYGQDAKGSFAALVRLASLPLPLPFKGGSRLRSALYVGNLVDALLFCCTSTSIRMGPYSVTDDADLSLEQMISHLREGMGRRQILFSAPWLEPALKAIGRERLAHQLFGEMRFPNELAHQGWSPPHRPQDALTEIGRSRRPNACSPEASGF